jgi:hypothetical protein
MSKTVFILEEISHNSYDASTSCAVIGCYKTLEAAQSAARAQHLKNTEWIHAESQNWFLCLSDSLNGIADYSINEMQITG